MTNMWSTEDTQRRACTPISTPAGSQTQGPLITPVSGIRGKTAWLKPLRKSNQYPKELLFKNAAITPDILSLCLVVQVSNHLKKILRNPAPGKYPPPSPPPSNKPQNCSLENPRPASPSPDFQILKEFEQTHHLSILGESLGVDFAPLVWTAWNLEHVVFLCAVYSK